jgi:pimeloyl-ACP methyl ester carboxylesterase
MQSVLEMSVKPFLIDIHEEVLNDVSERLKLTRWTDEVDRAGWDYGTNEAYLKEIADYWQNDYDWRKQEEALNKFVQFKAEIGGLNIHFIHERGKGKNPLSLILFHGWPDSFYRYHKIIPMLTDPSRFGGDSSDSFDVIVPSLPGFGFSDRPKTRGYRVADWDRIWAKLMTDDLGYSRFGAAGGDTGSPVAQLLALNHPDSVVGIHLTDVGWFKTNLNNTAGLSEEEQHYLGVVQGWFFQEGAYVMIQSTKPQTLAYGLNDSPIGLASWILEKFRWWSDCDGDIEKKFTKDELLTNIMIYWVTQTINSSIRVYYEESHNQSLPSGQHIEVPVGLALFPKDPPRMIVPRSWAERRLKNIERWTVMPRGGHFAAMEEPELLVEDLREFYRPLR